MERSKHGVSVLGKLFVYPGSGKRAFLETFFSRPGFHGLASRLTFSFGTDLFWSTHKVGRKGMVVTAE